MIDCLFIDPKAQHLADLPLLWQPTQGALQRVAAETLAEELGAAPIALVLPGQWVSACTVQLPTRKARWLRQALQYAAEEAFAEDIEQLQLALGETLDDGQARVLAVNRKALQGLLSEAKACGLNIAKVFAAHDLLPREHTQVALHLEDFGLLGGRGEARLAFPPSDWPQLAKQQSIILLESKTPYALLASGQEQAVDLAQGSLQQAERGGWARRWKPLLVVAGVALAIQLTFDLGQVLYLNKLTQQLEAGNRAIYQQLFPNETRIVDLRAQFDEHLRQAQNGGSPFFNLLEQTAQGIGRAPILVQSLDYSESRGDLSLELRAHDFAELEQLRQRLIDTGNSVQLGSANRDEQGVTARLVLGEGA